MSSTSVATDPIQLLIDDHNTVRELFTQYESQGLSANPDAKSQQMEIVKTIVKNLQVHEQLEEQLFYPFFKQHSDEQTDKDDIDQSLHEHHAVDILAKDLLLINDPNLEEFQSQFMLMVDNLMKHIEKEEKEIFPKAKDMLGDRAPGLLASMLQLKEKLESEIMQASDAELQEKGEEKASIEKQIPNELGAPTEVVQASEVTQAEAITAEASDEETAKEEGEEETSSKIASETSADESLTGKKHAASAESAKAPAAKKAKQR